MSEIDSYQHVCLGIVTCPSSYPVVPSNDYHRLIPLYRLDEDARDAASFQAKHGDVLLGGGSGESAALRVSLPGAFLFFTDDAEETVASRDELYRAYWRMTDAYVFGDGYHQLGWTPPDDLETWLVAHVLSFLVARYPQAYRVYCGSRPLSQDGTICRMPTLDEQRQC